MISRSSTTRETSTRVSIGRWTDDLPHATITEDDGIITVTTDRQGKLNAISPQVTEAYWEAVTRLEDRDDLRCMVITATGTYFTAGLDLSGPGGNRPGNPETEPDSYLGLFAKSFEVPVIDPKGVYPSDVTPVAISPALHGNGFWNSGALDRASGTPLPTSASVTFSTPGTYDYYCLIHPFMHGTVTVQ